MPRQGRYRNEDYINADAHREVNKSDIDKVGVDAANHITTNLQEWWCMHDKMHMQNCGRYPLRRVLATQHTTINLCQRQYIFNGVT